MPDPATIALLASSIVAGVNAVTQLVTIAQNPAASAEQRQAALTGANQVMQACAGLNAVWAGLAPRS